MEGHIEELSALRERIASRFPFSICDFRFQSSFEEER